MKKILLLRIILIIVFFAIFVINIVIFLDNMS